MTFFMSIYSPTPFTVRHFLPPKNSSTAENAKDWTFSENRKPLPIAGLKVKLIHLLTPYSINDRPENEE